MLQKHFVVLAGFVRGCIAGKEQLSAKSLIPDVILVGRLLINIKIECDPIQFPEAPHKLQVTTKKQKR